MACAQTHVAAWEEQKRLSCLSEEDLAEFKAKEDYFTCNLDEASLLCSEGNVKVLGGAGKRKHEKNVADTNDSITLGRI